ncbi:DUF29 domain-containing protein [Crocosphaera sp. XPORK-15E]|uniref:DUF29 domain-containing protein n=1 Tax=Crocosphaera sp. XPORK-15E TaxID=3110247 RepID=UPI002B1EF66D|nr:DUF29 domain-containing protein [Crocosphaera sp. XPORK-15E]MEA5533435.1 DUF29 domain-containing protein [Crocosphaera sp. XPORK-15E]
MTLSNKLELQDQAKLLYDTELQLWINKTINQLENRQFEQLDIEHLIEELRDLGKSDKTSLISNLKILIAHLLKLKVQFDAPETIKYSWYNSVDEHRERIQDCLNDNPSFNNFLPEAIEKAYPNARKLAIKEGKRATRGIRIPQENDYLISCPFTIKHLLDENFYGI